MRNLTRNLITRLRPRPTPPAPTITYEPRPAPLPHPPRRPESPLDGDASALVRPYLLAFERAEAERERGFLREMAVAS